MKILQVFTCGHSDPKPQEVRIKTSGKTAELKTFVCGCKNTVIEMIRTIQVTPDDSTSPH